MPVLFYLPLLLALSTQSQIARPAKPQVEIRNMTACVAVTRAEVEEALGQPVSNGKEHRAPGTSSCEYEAEGGQITIAIYRSQAKLDLPSEIKHLKKSIPDAKLRDVQGIGTRAFFMDMGAIGTQLHVIRGDFDYVLVSVLGFGGAAEVSSAAEKIARRALDRF